MKKILIMACVNIRWAYFRAHPGYVKIWMGDGDNYEEHFQNIKTGVIYYNYVWNDALNTGE